MAQTYPQIIELAKKSGLPYKVSSTFRLNAKTRSGKRSYHADGKAVDFGGHNQDALAAYFMGLSTLEVFHKSDATGTWYGTSNGQLTDESTHQDLVNEHRNHLHVAMSEDQVRDVKPSGLVAGIQSGITSLIGGVTNPAAGVVDVIRPVGIAAANVVNPKFWLRIGAGAVGVGLVVAGLAYWNRRPIGAVVGKVGGAAMDLAGTAIQGAAFGAGAGATSDIGKKKKAPVPVSGVPTTTPAKPPPRPPRMLPPSNAPTTSVLPPEIYAPVSAGGTYQVTSAKGRAPNPTQYQRPKGRTSLIPEMPTTRRKKSKKGAFKPTITNQMRDT